MSIADKTEKINKVGKWIVRISVLLVVVICLIGSRITKPFRKSSDQIFRIISPSDGTAVYPGETIQVMIESGRAKDEVWVETDCFYNMSDHFTGFRQSLDPFKFNYTIAKNTPLGPCALVPYHHQVTSSAAIEKGKPVMLTVRTQAN
jgi:hypothetical protein